MHAFRYFSWSTGREPERMIPKCYIGECRLLRGIVAYDGSRIMHDISARKSHPLLSPRSKDVSLDFWKIEMQGLPISLPQSRIRFRGPPLGLVSMQRITRVKIGDNAASKSRRQPMEQD